MKGFFSHGNEDWVGVDRKFIQHNQDKHTEKRNASMDLINTLAQTSIIFFFLLFARCYFHRTKAHLLI